MATSTAITTLLHEHEIILQVVKSLGGFAQALQQRQHVDLTQLREAVGFMRNFADRCHHAKEENLLFPALIGAGLAKRNGPVAVLEREHAQARECVSRLAAAADAYEQEDLMAPGRIIEAIGCIGELYPKHIAKENEVLFPMSEELLTPAALDELAEKFEDAERALGDDEHRHWAAVAQRLAQFSG